MDHVCHSVQQRERHEGSSLPANGATMDASRARSRCRLADYTALTGDQLRTDAADRSCARARMSTRVMDDVRAALPPALARNVTIADFASDPRAVAADFRPQFRGDLSAWKESPFWLGSPASRRPSPARLWRATKNSACCGMSACCAGRSSPCWPRKAPCLGVVAWWPELALGLAISQVLIQVINPQSFHWTMDIRLPGRCSSRLPWR